MNRSDAYERLWDFLYSIQPDRRIPSARIRNIEEALQMAREYHELVAMDAMTEVIQDDVRNLN